MRGYERRPACFSSPWSWSLPSFQGSQHRSRPCRLPQVIRVWSRPPGSCTPPGLKVDEHGTKGDRKVHSEGRFPDSSFPLDHSNNCHVHNVHHVSHAHRVHGRRRNLSRMPDAGRWPGPSSYVAGTVSVPLWDRLGPWSGTACVHRWDPLCRRSFSIDQEGRWRDSSTYQAGRGRTRWSCPTWVRRGLLCTH